MENGIHVRYVSGGLTLNVVERTNMASDILLHQNAGARIHWDSGRQCGSAVEHGGIKLQRPMG